MRKAFIAPASGPGYNREDESLPNARELLSPDSHARVVSTLAISSLSTSQILSF